MTIHKEGYKYVTVTLLLMILINVVVFYFFPKDDFIRPVCIVLTLGIQFIVTQFFRFPKRSYTKDESCIVAPCDGKVVVIEQTVETEYYKEKRIQVSIFMSPLNVHINWYPLSGKISYLKYHPGKYLVAWDPKSSTENERSTIVIEKDRGVGILVRQIAGALARRIVYYPQEGDMIKQSSQLGFIKFGSRVDVFLPLTAKVNVKLGEKTTGGVTVIAEL